MLFWKRVWGCETTRWECRAREGPAPPHHGPLPSLSCWHRPTAAVEGGADPLLTAPSPPQAPGLSPASPQCRPWRGSLSRTAFPPQSRRRRGETGATGTSAFIAQPGHGAQPSTGEQLPLGRCHIPLQRPRSSPWYRCPSHRQAPWPRPPQPGTFPRGTRPSLLPTPPAPHPSQHLPHSPLPTSSSLPHPREPPRGPRDPRAACPTHRGVAGPRAMTPISADEGSARATRYICPRSRAALCRPAQGTSSLRGPLSIPTGAAPQLRLEAGADPWCGCASVLRAPAALRPPCKAQIAERGPQCQDPHAVSTQEGQSIPRERARRSTRGHLRGGQRGVEQQRGPEPVELRQRQLAVLG